MLDFSFVIAAGAAGFAGAVFFLMQDNPLNGVIPAAVCGGIVVTLAALAAWF